MDTVAQGPLTIATVITITAYTNGFSVSYNMPDVNL